MTKFGFPVGVSNMVELWGRGCPIGFVTWRGGGGVPKRVGGQIREISSLCLLYVWGPSKFISLAHGRVKQEDRYGLQDNLLLRFVRKGAGPGALRGGGEAARAKGTGGRGDRVASARTAEPIQCNKHID